MRREKVAFAILIVVWLFVLTAVGGMRRVVAHEYLQAIPVSTQAELPDSTRTFALPILAADVTQGIPLTIFAVYWAVLWLWPLGVLIWLWSADDRTTLVMRWAVGMSSYAIVVFASLLLVTFSLWLPLRG